MKALNEELLKGNTCFGCGPDNTEGLQIRIFRDGDRADRLVGVYRPRQTAGGFPQIVHGGLQFTVLDCMAGWAVFVLKNPGKMMPLTKSASTRFYRPARLGTELALSAAVAREAASPRDPLLIHTEIRDPDGTLLTEIDFEYATLPLERFMKAAGIAVMPDSYRRHFGEA
ncbi:MAG TPA: PaaI family thioesterase [Burkholderiales bacterium]|nr:PaaI family thioesterase [Burkholderiales bacterium]